MCKKDNEYNGWSNYETWVTKLWLDNDQDTYNKVREWAEEEQGNYGLSKRIKEYVEETNPIEGLEATVYNDLLSGAISSINFYEIAENIYSEEE